MLRIITLLVAASLNAFAAAPDSIAGLVYRESFARASIRTAMEKTIVFSEGGRFTFLKFASVSFVATEFGGRVVLQAPRSDGAYTYRKTGDATATLELRFDQGGTETMSLVFSSPLSGHGDPAGAAFPDYTFSLAALAATQSAPAMNVSMRGRVGAGQPLVVGFVVPGARPADGVTRQQSAAATQRDVLIRAVGPSLAPFGVANVWADPDFVVYEGTRLANLAQFPHGDWAALPVAYDRPESRAGVMAGFRKVFDYVGAFPLSENSKDAAAIVRLAPGAYTIVAEPAAGASGGEALIEVYFLP